MNAAQIGIRSNSYERFSSRPVTLPSSPAFSHELMTFSAPTDYLVGVANPVRNAYAPAPQAQVELTRASHLQATGIATEGPFPSTALRLTSPLLGVAGAALQFSLQPEGWNAALVSSDGGTQDLAKVGRSSFSPNEWHLSDGKTVTLSGQGLTGRGPSVTIESADGRSAASLNFRHDGKAEGSHVMHLGPDGKGSTVNHWEAGSGGQSCYRLDAPLGPENTVASALANLLPKG